MDGADKPGLEVGGRPLLVSVAHAAAVAGTRRLVIVGPPRPGAVQAGLAALAADRSVSLSRVLEDPPGGGPVAGLRRGLVEVAAPWLALLAADLPFLTATQLTDMLLTAQAHRPAATGVVLTDAEGRPQWLISCWRTSTLRPALAAYDGGSLHSLLAPLRPALGYGAVRPGDALGAAMPAWLDCDTPDELAAARLAWLANAGNAADTGG
jgi:molybdopterin-guanine dinucleotide biosynthesis protein A